RRTGTGTTRDDVSGALDGTSSFNLIGDGTNMSGISNGNNGNQIGSSGSPINALLSPLATNGGPTQTHSLQCTSPAIDKGKAFSLTTDQRGVTRPFDLADSVYPNAGGGDSSDIGAFETGLTDGCLPATLQVNSKEDTDNGSCNPLGPGTDCTLREAIKAANTNPGAEAITFAPALTAGGPATISLSTALPDISTDMAIQGPGAKLLTVERKKGAATRFRIFTITASTTVNISGMTITKG